MTDDPLRQRMRAADPAADLPTADPDRVARLLEDTMNTTSTQPRTVPARRRAVTWMVAAASVVVAGAVVLSVVDFGDDPQPPVAAPPSASTSAGTGEPGESGSPGTDGDVLTLQAPSQEPVRCARPSVAFLDEADVAFDGTVTGVDGETVSLDVSQWYRGGEDADQVRVTGPSAQLQALLLSVDFEVGKRYLVSSYDGVVSVCGLTAEHSPQLENLYERAF